MSTISAAIVSYHEEPAQLRAAVESLLSQTRPPVEVLIMDNGEDGRLEPALADAPASVKHVKCPENLGYTALNLAAERCSGDYLVCLNPDARAQADCLEQLAAVADADASVGIVGAQIVLDDWSTRNAGANPLHPTGISPSGGYGEPREDGEPSDAMVASGACFLARRETYMALGGFVKDFFLYYEDVDLSWRTRIAGRRVVYCPRAVVAHSYDFGARAQKWFLLERNRLYSVLANYQIGTLLLLAPMLLACEAGLIVVAAHGGWLGAKLRAYRSLFTLRKHVLASRRAVQESRRCGDRELLGLFQDRLDSALIPGAGAALANAFCVPYMAIVRRLLRCPVEAE
jgi:GT2 family glycosyltransferase